MPRLLYLTPYFPPLARAGAQRPFRFVRHLAAHGWQVVVLCDLWHDDPWDVALLDALPSGTPVVRNWSRRARPAQAAWRGGALPAVAAQAAGAAAPQQQGRWQRLRAALPAWLDNPELVPLGEHGPRLPWAYAAASSLLREQPCDLILANCDPFATAVVGAALARRSGLPLVVDMQDPWAPCDLRRPLRPAPTRVAVDAIERAFVTAAARVILNTEGARDAYRHHYADLDPEHFTAIRNHADPDLLRGGSHPGFDRFTALYLGNFNRFNRAEVLLDALAILQGRGIGPDQLQLVITGEFPADMRSYAEARGLAAALPAHPRVPQREIAATMAAADLLVGMLQPGVMQRITSKVYDYLVAERPILVIADNPELAGLVAASGAGETVRHGDPVATADAIEAVWRRGRGQVVPRRPVGATSSEATAALAAVLDRALATRR